MAEFTGVRAKGAGIEIRFQHQGQPYSVYVDKSPTETNKADASRYRKSLIQKLKRGESINDELVENPTFEKCCSDFLTAKARELKPSTINGYRQKLEYYWSDLGHKLIRDIRLPHLREIDRSTQWGSQKTRREAISNLKQVFKFAMDEDIVDSDPSIKMRAGKWQKPEIDAYSHEEKEAIIAELFGKYLVFYTLMFEQGVRTGELQALQWPDIRRNEIQIERSMYRGQVVTVKTHEARKVLLTNRSIAALESFTETRFGRKWVFTNYQGQPFANDRSLTIQFKKACEAAGVRYRRPYYARHTFATHAFMAGCEPGFVAAQMGDRLETVLRNYATWIRGDKDRAQLAILNGEVGNQLGIGEVKKV